MAKSMAMVVMVVVTMTMTVTVTVMAALQLYRASERLQSLFDREHAL